MPENEKDQRLRDTWAVLDAVNAMHPDQFKVGQEHLPPAFREVNFRAAFETLIDFVNDIERVSGYADRHAIPPGKASDE